MKTFQIRITKEGKHRCLKFKSELPMESVLAAVKAVVKNTYNVSIKEIHWRVPEERDIMWAINEAKAVRFYAKVWKINCHKVPTVIQLGQISLPHGTKIESNSSESVTFFNIITPYDIELDLLKIKEESNLDIHCSVILSNKKSKIYKTVISGRNQCIKFLDRIYDDAELFLYRKYEIYLSKYKSKVA